MSNSNSLPKSSDSSRSLTEEDRLALRDMLQLPGWQVYLRLVQADQEGVLARLSALEDPTSLFRAQGELAAIKRLVAKPREVLQREGGR